MATSQRMIKILYRDSVSLMQFSEKLCAKDDSSVDAALEQAEAMLKKKSAEAGESGVQRVPPRSIYMGLEPMPAENFVLISTPGEYAAAEARKALQLGLHVMMFSDNVSMAEEIPLKQYARAHDLLVMGPDCGAAGIDERKVVDTGLAPVINTGIAHKDAGVGQVGAGITRAPLECFNQAIQSELFQENRKG